MTPITPIERIALRKLYPDKSDGLYLEDYELSTQESQTFLNVRERIRTGEPLDYVLGKLRIMNVELHLTPDVLIPRPETLWWLVKIPIHYPQHSDTLICDLGTGSGVIALYLAQHTQAKIVATDISEPAIVLAKQNAYNNGIITIDWIISDLFASPILQNTIRKSNKWVLVANLPYVPLSDKHSESYATIQYEPEQAIFSGSDGLDTFNQCLQQLQSLPIPTVAYFELDPRNITKAEIAAKTIFPHTQIFRDDSGFKRLLICSVDKILPLP